MTQTHTVTQLLLYPFTEHHCLVHVSLPFPRHITYHFDGESCFFPCGIVIRFSFYISKLCKVKKKCFPILKNIILISLGWNESLWYFISVYIFLFSFYCSVVATKPIFSCSIWRTCWQWSCHLAYNRLCALYLIGTWRRQDIESGRWRWGSTGAHQPVFAPALPNS